MRLIAAFAAAVLAPSPVEAQSIGLFESGLFAISEVEQPPLQRGVREPHAETPTHRH